MSLRGNVVRNPVIMAVDDEVGVLHAVERDLRSHYSGRFRILAALSGESALEALRELKVREIRWPCCWSISGCRA